MEMSFADQEDVFEVIEKVIPDMFRKFSNKSVSKSPIQRIPYKTAMLKYGTDKPDLRNPLDIVDVTDLFKDLEFKASHLLHTYFSNSLSSNDNISCSVAAFSVSMPNLKLISPAASRFNICLTSDLIISPLYKTTHLK